MSIILKNNLLDTTSSEKLYRDALVSDGTLTLVDFSNKGCLTDYDLTTVKDLALEAKEDLSIINDIRFEVTDRGEVPLLNEKKGYPAKNLGSYSSTSYDSGLNIYNIDSYLFNNQPNSLIVIWLDAQGNDGAGTYATDTVLKSGDSNNENIRLAGGNLLAFSLRYGGPGFLSFNIPSNVFQVAVEFIDNTQPTKLYVNGKFHGYGNANAYGFKQAEGNNPISLGQKTPASKNLFNFYRLFIEDLEVSGRTALEVVEQDFNYVNAINEYQGIEKRPFSNI